LTLACVLGLLAVGFWLWQPAPNYGESFASIRNLRRFYKDARELITDLRNPIQLGEGAAALEAARNIVDRMVATHWKDDAPPSPAARDFVAALILHLHGHPTTRRLTRLYVARVIHEAASAPRSLLRDLRAANVHPYATNTAVDLLGCSDEILAEIFRQADCFVRGDHSR
jgi:hypothetical protein